MDDEALRKEILSRFSGDSVLDVKLSRHGDHPWIEPGELHVELVPRGPEEYSADPDTAPEEVSHQVVFGFQHAHDAAIQQLCKDLPELTGGRARRLGMHYGREGLSLSVHGLPTKPTKAEDDERLRQEILSRFPENVLLEVQIQRHGDRPELIDPGELRISLVPRGPEEYNADPGRAPKEVCHQVVYGFQHAHDAAVQKLRKDLQGLVSERVRGFSIGYGREGLGLSVMHELPPAERGLTSVMARLNQTDLETLDTLIAAGLATSRAEGVRWCLARIRERPAYAQIQQRVREIEQLKAQF